MRILPRLAFQAVDAEDGVGWMATWVVSVWRAHLYRPLGHGVPRQITKKIVRLKRVETCYNCRASKMIHLQPNVITLW